MNSCPSASDAAGDRPGTESPNSRREFLATAINSAATTVAFAALPTIVSAKAMGFEAGTKAANERLTLGVIGFGRRCKYVLTEMLKFPDVQCVAIADVMKQRRTEGKQFVDAASGTSDCTTTGDLRELLARTDIDCVLIATGDRWHGKASIMAAEAGKESVSRPSVLIIHNKRLFSRQTILFERHNPGDPQGRGPAGRCSIRYKSLSIRTWTGPA